MNPRFGLSDKLTNLVLRRLFWLVFTVQESAKRANAMLFAKIREKGKRKNGAVRRIGHNLRFLV